ncbi:MAG: acetylxylan esterase [Candidatus Pedobacter colombiensis]|uniref:Acetylxylan esterase n=1 Tax=Candidatus Pedobacter colombiensis TaxID=3121371 RepID=A0AAJ5W8W6_9SPHI|nr:acetylxylan esterase [Pedobacter sp.]WEK20182.1 MAG: acetylxylan esterase [Pedobacter sp.]
MKRTLIPVLFISCLFIALEGYAQAPLSNIDETKVPAYTLPDVLKMQNGKTVKNSTEWEKVQRPYIYNLYQTIQFGKYPVKSVPIRFEVMKTDHTKDGFATRKQIRIYLHPTDNSIYTDVLLYLPAKLKKPVAVFVGYNFSGNHALEADSSILLSQSWMPARGKGVVNNRATDLSRGTDITQWQVKEILSHGYALATAYYGDLEPDNAEGWKTGIRTTLKNVLKIQPEEWSAMGAWAYGLSRIYDYLEKDKDIDAKKIAVIGHSRLGKAALWAAASDPRFSLIISNESGEGGAALSKRWYGETVKIITEKFPHWFGANYKTYGDKVTDLPIDAHMLLSLMAPRPLYVASAEGDTWSDPKGEFLSAKEAGRVYALYGKKGIQTDELPALHQPVGNIPRYHIRAGKHDVTLYDWQQYLKFADEQWK